MENRTYENNNEAIEAWNTILFDKFVRFRDTLTRGLAIHGDELLQRHPVRPGSRVLDLGCGFGDTTIDLARRTGETGVATGVDAAARFIDVARRDATQAGIMNARFVVADVCDWPLRSVETGHGIRQKVPQAPIGTAIAATAEPLTATMLISTACLPNQPIVSYPPDHIETVVGDVPGVVALIGHDDPAVTARRWKRDRAHVPAVLDERPKRREAVVRDAFGHVPTVRRDDDPFTTRGESHDRDAGTAHAGSDKGMGVVRNIRIVVESHRVLLERNGGAKRVCRRSNRSQVKALRGAETESRACTSGPVLVPAAAGRAS
jgi:SAM-dependent methyltransferase